EEHRLDAEDAAGSPGARRPLRPRGGGGRRGARRPRLYPGTYEVDRVEGPVFAVGGERFVVDGDPRTPTEVYGGTQLVPALGELAEAHALAAAAACQRAGTCELGDDVLLGSSGDVHVQWSDLPRGVVQLLVPLVENRGSSAQWLDMEVRLTVEPGGTPVRWECGVPGEYGGDLATCPDLG
ncbi:hypothetical protein, partial [Agrococcus sp. HG114]|uniref:hypothetical protein n=1 Tax=Agrococcus sp. HG114 TaxID=2969757 RepID=UPI00215ABC32